MQALALLFELRDYSDVVCEAQEVMELTTKALLRSVGIEPHRFHDVGQLLLQHRERFNEKLAAALPEIAQLSLLLRKEREIAFYGDIDLIPSQLYSREVAENFLLKTQKAIALIIANINTDGDG